MFKAGILLVTFWLLWQAVSKKVEPLLFAVAGLTGLLIILDRTDVRPEIFSYLFLAYFCLPFSSKIFQNLLALHSSSSAASLDDMHIYFILGPTLLLLFLIDRFLKTKEILNPKH